MKTIARTMALASVVVVAFACSDDKPESEESSGGENAFDRAEANLNEAQQDFQEEFKDERKFVDDKANEAAEEGRKGARKVGDALSGDDDESSEPEEGKP